MSGDKVGVVFGSGAVNCRGRRGPDHLLTGRAHPLSAADEEGLKSVLTSADSGQTDRRISVLTSANVG
jgi:hypothetical protein